MHARRLTLDIDPWTLFRSLARKERPFFVDAGRPWSGEWVSSMGFRPRMQLRIAPDATVSSPLAALDAVLAPLAPPAHERTAVRPVPFGGGAVVALAYEMKNAIERLPQTQAEDPRAPHLVAAVYDAVVAYDHYRRSYWIASWSLDDAALSRYADEVRAAAADAVDGRGASDQSADDAAGSLELSEWSATDGGSFIPRAPAGSVTSNLQCEEYAQRVERIREYIGAGDVYQVNLSLRFHAALPCSPLRLYGRLRRVQPVPFGGYFDLGRERVLSNSPELFLRRRGTRVATCPIKGTRPRGRTRPEDERLAHALRADPKECAEHVMIVDLERSDLGRVCRTGSVRVTRFAEVASFRTVHHLVSTIEGEVPASIGAGDLLRATFPSGSITGAPKIRAMEIIDEVERGPRGFYTGALGWVDASGDCDLNVAIRTAVADEHGVAYHAGSGIVADSQPEREYAESLLKAQAFFRALGVAETEVTAGAAEGQAASAKIRTTAGARAVPGSETAERGV